MRLKRSKGRLAWFNSGSTSRRGGIGRQRDGGRRGFNQIIIVIVVDERDAMLLLLAFAVADPNPRRIGTTTTMPCTTRLRRAHDAREEQRIHMPRLDLMAADEELLRPLELAAPSVRIHHIGQRLRRRVVVD